MEKAFAEALMTIVCQPMTDQYGNRRESFLIDAVSQWFHNNREAVGKILKENINTETFAGQVAEQYKKSMNSYDRDRFNTGVDGLFQNKLAELLAKDAYDKIKSQSPELLNNN